MEGIVRGWVLLSPSCLSFDLCVICVLLRGMVISFLLDHIFGLKRETKGVRTEQESGQSFCAYFCVWCTLFLKTAVHAVQLQIEERGDKYMASGKHCH